jgi:hypothetical protein
VNLSALDTVTRAEEGVEFEVIHPRIGATGVFLRMLGSDSRQYRSALKEVSKKLTPETTQAELETELSIRCTLGWRGIEENGEELRFNEANLRRVYTSAPIVREQSIAFMRDRGNFFRVEDIAAP